MAEKRSALIVATSTYEDARLSPLGGPGEDAEALEKVLADAEVGGFEVQLALNAQHDVLRTTLEGFFTDRGRDDLLLVHFSGHGLKDDDGQLYLAAADTRIDRLMSTGIEAGWVNRLMNRCRSEKIALFLDCCFGGAFTAGLARRAGVDTAGAKETFAGTGRFVITASDAMQYSFESGERIGDSEPQPSPFTGALVEGLRTGEADRNEDGYVSINELFDYLEDRVRQLSPAQTPTKSAFNQVGDWVIASSTRAPTIRILPASIQSGLKSDEPMDRLTAVFDLRDLIRQSDPRVAEAARKALEKLAGDDSKKVAAAASRMFGEAPDGEPADGVVTSTKLSQSDLPDAIKDALVKTPDLVTDPAPTVTPNQLTSTAPASAAPASTEPPPRRPGEAVTTPQPQAAPAQGAPQVLTTNVLSSNVLSSQALTPNAPRPQPAAAPVLAPQPASPIPSPQSAPPPGALWGSSTAPTAAPRDEAMWGPATGHAAPAPLGAPSIAGGSTLPWSPRRAAARAAIGTYLGFAGFIALIESPAEILSLGGIVVMVIAAIIVASVVLAAEFVVGGVRIPGGFVFRVVGGNRWVASAIVGGIVGLVADLVFYSVFGHVFGMGIVAFAAGFVLAEGLVGRRFGRRPVGAAAAS